MPDPLVQPCPKQCNAICAEIAKVKRLQTEAQMAAEVYNPSGQRNVPGYDEVTDPDELAKLGLTPEQLTPKDSQFRAAVFKAKGAKDYVVAFKGTTMDSLSDWQANLGQGAVGYSSYYQQAKLIGRDASAMVGGGDVGCIIFVGHSLGGGLASAAAHATGNSASTFNAAGLHVLNRDLIDPPPIDAVRVNGDILTSVQSLAKPLPFVAPQGAGTPYQIDPPPSVASALSKVSLDGWDALMPLRIPYKYAKAAIGRAVELHLMSSVNPALAAQGEKLQKKANAANCSCPD